MSIDWTPIYKKYKGKWLALDQDERTVLSAGVEPKDVLKKAKDKGYKRPILTKVPTKFRPYIGHGLKV